MEKLIDECGTPKDCWKCQPEPCDQCDPIKDGEITRLIMDNAAKDQQIATLKKALELMAKYIVEFGRVDYFLCDNIPQSLHLKYQPKNDGNYENKPCIECVQKYFIQQAQKQEESHE